MSGTFTSKVKDLWLVIRLSTLLFLALYLLLAYQVVKLDPSEQSPVWQGWWWRYQVCQQVSAIGYGDVRIPYVFTSRGRASCADVTSALELHNPEVTTGWQEQRIVLLARIPAESGFLVLFALACWNFAAGFADRGAAKSSRSWPLALAVPSLAAAWALQYGFPISKVAVAFLLALPTAYFGLAMVRHAYRDDRDDSTPDVRDDVTRLSKMQRGFDPETYIDLKRGLFLGLNETSTPMYVPLGVLTKNHIEIIGASGTGKSSIAGVLMAQLLQLGETVVAIDPKDDANLLGTLARAAAKAGKVVHVIDLRMEAPCQINPFLHCSAEQMEELLQVGLELGKTGDPAVDFHRGGDRQATGWMAQAVHESGGRINLPSLLHTASQDERIVDRENLWREFTELARLHAIQADGGLDLKAVIESGGLLYVIGSTTDLKAQAATRMILQRVLQIIDQRADKRTPVCLFLDELKYLLSGPTLRAAGTIRDRNCHLIFAHQSLGDLADCPGLPVAAVEGAVWGNSSIRFVYRLEDAETAKRLEVMAGLRRGRAVSNNSNRQRGIGGTESDGTSIADREAALMPAHIFTNLPKPTEPGQASVCVVFGLGVAGFLATRYLESGPRPAPVVFPRTVANQAGTPASASEIGTHDRRANSVAMATSHNGDDMIAALVKD